MIASSFFAVFVIGMVVTHWDAVTSSAGFDRLAGSDCPVVMIHDGDTIRCGMETIRIENIDAPELEGSPRCSPYSVQRLYNSQNPAWCDDEMGVASREALAAFLKVGPIKLTRHATDRYGRTLAKASVRGRDAGQHLVAMGLARVWH
ncbi:thermonuclease family protein [Novosphingobium sp. PY1]|uniref:thermonuclease family protein n=1 Tax=Novosphingobium sp. PY1 TaxID=1882221 RepID=UPI001AA627AC|nr:thermonuclease family protein [Novosphingobium sp. PY1]GFM30729.1 uncharacterized protein PY1_contig-12-90 [Novosphingobium sp. PY1]